jgi:3-oxoacyl-[acyl-carrier protein] reductase
MKLAGIYPIVPTPFNESGRIDPESIQRLTVFMVDCGVQGLAILGVMGEAQKLNDTERVEVIRAFRAALPENLALVVGVRAAGPVSILVTNSGGPPPGPFDAADDEKWVSAYSLTFLSAVRLIRALLPDMKALTWGRIINFTSRSLKEPIPNLIISNAVRLAVGGMAKTLAGEVASFGITVNNVCPGPTTTDRALNWRGRERLR